MPFFGRLLAHVAERINVTFNSEEMFFNLSHAMIMFAILVGGTLLLLLVRELVKRCAFPRSYGAYVNTGKVDPSGKLVFKRRSGLSTLAARHVLMEVSFMVALFATFWIAAYTAGFNMFSSGYTTLAATLIGTYMFAGALQNFGSGFWLNVEGSYEEGNYVVVPSMGQQCHGFVASKTAFHTMLRRLKTKAEGNGLCEFRVPNSIMMSAMTYRDYGLETADLRVPMEINDKEKNEVLATGKYKFPNITYQDGVDGDTTTHAVALAASRVNGMVYRRSKDV